jgi:hypothetical protein
VKVGLKLGLGRTADAAADGDQFAQSRTAQPPWLSPLAGRFRVGESGQQLQPATATVGFEPLRRRGHEPNVPSGEAFVKAECGAPRIRHIRSPTRASKAGNHHSGQSSVVIHRCATKPAAMDSPRPLAIATPTATPRSPSSASTADTIHAEIAATTVHQA